jgi:hypothetical protein
MMAQAAPLLQIARAAGCSVDLVVAAVAAAAVVLAQQMPLCLEYHAALCTSAQTAMAPH